MRQPERLNADLSEVAHECGASVVQQCLRELRQMSALVGGAAGRCWCWCCGAEWHAGMQPIVKRGPSSALATPS